MLLIFLSRAAFSLLSGSFGSFRFFSLGTSPARGWRWPTGAWTVGCAEFFGTVEPCANASGQTVRTISAADRIIFRIVVLSRFPLCLSRRNVDRATIAPPLGGAILHLSYISHGAEQPDACRHQHREESQHHRVFDGAVALVLRRLLASLVPIRHRRVTAWADRDERHRNNQRYDNAFPRIVHVLRNSDATNKSDRSAPCHGRRECRAHNPAGTGRTHAPASRASIPGPVRSSCADARCPAQDRHGAGTRA